MTPELIIFLVISMADSEFTPLDTMAHIFSRWWIAIVLAVLGGIIGWAFHFLQPPVYEATAVLTVNIDFPQLELSQYEEDVAFNVAEAITGSAAVKDQIVTKALTERISINSAQLERQLFSERKLSVLELHVMDRDPQVAAELANTWALAATDALNNALEHAIQAEQFQHQVDLLEVCLPFLPGMTGSDAKSRPIPKDCGRFSPVETQKVLQSWTEESIQEKQLSLGILPIMEFALTENASIPEKPVLYNQGSLTLVGALIGFILSVWVAGSRRVQRRA